MPTVLPVPINPTVLEWARKESGYAVNRVADRLHVKPERIEAWERGERPPTLRQVQELARFFHRPLNVFFLPAPPQVPPLAAEYRRLPGVTPGQESPELRLAVRQMINRRETALGLIEELGKSVTAFPLTTHLNPKAEYEEADAYVIALAKLRDGIVVTQETSAAEKNQPKRTHFIPDVCRELGLHCITLLGLMRREGWKF